MKLKILNYSLLGIIIFVTSSCAKDKAEADFTPSTYTGTAPTRITFSNTSRNSTYQVWDFGDGYTTTEKNPSHIFTQSGIYYVQLFASNDGSSSKKIISINIISQPKPNVDFSFTPSSIMAPSKVTFKNLTTGATQYLWDFGNGKTSSAENPDIVYTQGGNYNVTLTATGPGGTSTITKTIQIQKVPTKLNVTSMKLINYPQTKPDGTAWDPFDFPDLYFAISDDAGTNFVSSYYFGDVIKSQLPLTYTDNFPWTFSNLDYKYIVWLRDYEVDDSSFENMAGYYFKVRDFMPTDGSEYPKTFVFKSSTSDLSFTMEVEWLP